MEGKLRNMASVYIQKDNKILLLYRQGGRVVNDVWVGSAGGHFEAFDLNDARACVLRELQEELGITEHSIENLRLRYVTLRRSQEEIRQKVMAALAEHGECTPENVDRAMSSKIYDLEDLIDIREYVRRMETEQRKKAEQKRRGGR